MKISSVITEQFLLIVIVTLLIIWLISKYFEYRKLPPGPYGLPLVGYLPFLKGDSHKVFSKLAEKYGNIFSINLGTSKCIIINDCEMMKKVLNNPASYSRPDGFGQILKNSKNFAVQNGKEWLLQRRYCVTALKDLGVGRGHWEDLMRNESTEFIKKMESWKGKPVDFQNYLKFSMANNIISLLVGKRLCHVMDSEESKLIMDFADIIIKMVTSSSISNNIPLYVLNILEKLGIGGYYELFKSIEKFEKIIEREIMNRIKSAESGEHLTFIDLYLQQIEKQGNDYKDNYFSHSSLVGNIIALFLGAMDTTKASVQWLILLLAAFPDIQQKIHQEMDDIAKHGRQIYWDERNNFPYLLAFINEMQRWVAVAPLYPNRQMAEAMEIDQYIIPKGANIIVNNWGLMRDKKYHTNPDKFDPGRFLKNDRLGKVESFFPFSTGKRNCPGEHIANMSIFLYFTAIVQKFRITCPQGKTVILEDRGEGSVRHAVAQELCFIER